ncbi:MAG TPA: glycoside hydrolase family 3 N-terminal domain-containing protein [Polyangia bacterium]|nr:glycoside hydrolase family 3 N-terminal domain-containing protein [Polyangia bacterium]
MFRSDWLRFARAMVVVALAAPACSLPTPHGLVGDGGIATGQCPVVAATPDGGAGTGTGVTVSADPKTVVTPVSCAGTGANPNAIDRYTQGYSVSADVTQQVAKTISSMSLHDLALQMEGMPYNSTGQFSDTQRSQDTGSIRGFRYRDASRGMNLGEDMNGSFPNAATINGSHVGYSTVFPVSMARGAAFDLDLEYAIGEAIGDEMQAAKQTVLLAPCMNILRHPLWGRAQETYGEDSFHVGRLASAMVVGVQQHIAANAKHYMGYDIENGRTQTNNSLMADEQVLRETYGRHFRMTVQDAGVASVMASYNEVDGIKSTQNGHILTDVLRKDFGFQGFVLSDWWAMPGFTSIPDTSTQKTGALKAINAGLDVELPWGLYYGQLENLVNSGTLTRQDLQAHAQNVLTQKFRFNSQNLNGPVGLKAPVTIYENSQIKCNESHIALAKQAALESMVLLKNDKGTLPISASVKKVAVLGANIPYVSVDGGNGSNGANRTVNFATEIRTGDLGSSRAFSDPKDTIGPADGITMTAPPGVNVVSGTSVDVASDADFIVVMAGLTPQDEGEEYTKAGDRASLALDAKQAPGMQNIQNKLITDAAALGKPMVVVLEGGSVIDMPWLNQVPAVVMAWYPGQRGGEAIGDLLWGQVGGVSYNFSGKLPITWGKQLSDYDVFTATGSATTTFNYYVGYRWFDQHNTAPLFPFGAGLSYTTFEYRKLQLGCSDMSKGAVLPVVVNVANTGTVDGDETVMVFVSFPDTTARRGPKELKAFARVHLAAGEEKQVSIPLRLADLDYFKIDANDPTKGVWTVESGRVQIMVGGSAANLPLMATVNNVTGYTVGTSQ